jgi:hypothetical protein
VLTTANADSNDELYKHGWPIEEATGSMLSIYIRDPDRNLTVLRIMGTVTVSQPWLVRLGIAHGGHRSRQIGDVKLFILNGLIRTLE